MSPEFAMANAMFEVVILPALGFILALVGGLLTGFFLDRHSRKNKFMNSSQGKWMLGLAAAASFILACIRLLAPTLTLDGIIMAFIACALVSFWNEMRKRP